MSTTGDDETVVPVDDLSDEELAAQLEPPVGPLSPEAQERTSEEVMGLLAEHVPLALLADLASPDGPISQAILEEEGLPEDAWWEADEDQRAEDPDGTGTAT